MRKLTIRLPEKTFDRLRGLAASREISVEQYICEVLEDVAGGPNTDWIVEHDALLAEIGSRTPSSAWDRLEIYEDLG